MFFIVRYSRICRINWSAMVTDILGPVYEFVDDYRTKPEWLGWAMVLGSFQCRGVLLLLRIVGQGLAVLAAGAGRVGYIFYIFHLPSLSNVLSFGRRLNMTELLWFWLLKPNGSCQLLPRTSSLSTG